MATYTVKKGDTLSQIAANNGTTVSALLKLNPGITNANLIYAGQTIVVSGTPATVATSTSGRPVVDRYGVLANSNRAMYAGWTWAKHSSTDHYKIIWSYSYGIGIEFKSESTTKERYSTYTPPDYATHVTLIVRAMGKPKTVNGSQVENPISEWSTRKTYWYTSNKPETPPAPTVTIKDYTLTAELRNLDLENATHIKFQVAIQGSNKAYKTSGNIPIVQKRAAYSCTVAAGNTYVVRCKAIGASGESDWSDGWSDGAETKPSASSGITVCRGESETSVYLEWSAVDTATGYEIEYTTDKSYFDESSETTTLTSSTNRYTVTGLEPGQQYFFRVRAVNEQGESAWTSIKSVIIGTPPAPPTTWSSTTTAVVGETLNLYWMHNTEDGSSQTYAELELTINGVVETKTIKNSTEEDEKDRVSFYEIDTSAYPEGTKILWKVRTKGIIDEYGDWSIQRAIDVYAPPTLSLNVSKRSVNLILTGSGSPDEYSSTPALDPAGTDGYVLIPYAYSGPLDFSEIPTNAKYQVVANGVTYQGFAHKVTVSDTSYYVMFGNSSILTAQIQFKDQSAILSQLQTTNDPFCIAINVDTSDGMSLMVDSIHIFQKEGAVDESLTLSLVGYEEIDILEAFPLCVSAEAGPNNQTPIGYNLVISANEAYETLDHVGNPKMVSKGDPVFSRHYDIDADLFTELSASDIDLENNISYTVECIVSMNSGLTATDTATFTVAWTDDEYAPSAEIGIDLDTYSAIIRPYCEDFSGNLIEDVVLSVYRREYDGSFTEIIKNIENVREAYITDPHPSLDYARYRIVAMTKSTGAMSVFDVPPYPVGGKEIVLQWDDVWSDFIVDEETGQSSEPAWTGSMLKLPYNIDVSNNHQPDVELVEYIGRSNPVSYYGTQHGETATWNVDIDAKDTETLYQLRRLSKWMGNVYVREPSGSGYWAHVVASFSQKHREVTIPVQLEIIRVEGGM